MQRVMEYHPVIRELVGLQNSDQLWAVIYADYETGTAELVTVTGPPKKVAVSFSLLVPSHERFAAAKEQTAA